MEQIDKDRVKDGIDNYCGDGLGGNGEKGYGLGISYMLADNTNLEFDEEGKKISAVPWVLADDWGGVEHFANQDNCLSLVTGESIGQVASQTMHSLYVTNEVCQMPVFRPCIGLDKNEIVKVAEKIGTYETSILPYEDCCTIFVAKHPVTKPRLDVIKRSERNLDDCIDELMKTAIETTEEIKIHAH